MLKVTRKGGRGRRDGCTPREVFKMSETFLRHVLRVTSLLKDEAKHVTIENHSLLNF